MVTRVFLCSTEVFHRTLRFEGGKVMKRRVLIRTLPLGRNYGGIMQGYALQKAIQHLGHEAVTDTSYPTDWRRRIGKHVIAFKRSVAPTPWVFPELGAAVNAKLRRFVMDEVRTIDLYKGRLKPRSTTWSAFDTLMVGSDQVWRSAYANVGSYLLDFASEATGVRRIAYAGSFGTDTLDGYEDAMLPHYAKLAQAFDAITVREVSGLGLVHKHWGVEARHMPDPTLLLDVSRYEKLADRAKGEVNSGDYLASYFLDSSEVWDSFIADLASSLALVKLPIMPAPPSSVQEYVNNPSRFLKPSVEAWLLTIRDAQFIVTDSFHGVVFSILFNTPFLAVANMRRGYARFESVLREYNLMDRLHVASEPPHVASINRHPIDWGSVNAITRLLRERGTDFLTEVLS